MKKTSKIIITTLFVMHVLFMIFTSKMRITFINGDIAIYAFIGSVIISLMYLRVLIKSSDLVENYSMLLVFIAFLLCLKVQLIILLALMGIKVLGRYERTTFNRLMKIASIIFMVIAVFSFIFIPAMVSNFQENDYNVYKILESENGDNITVISNYATSDYVDGYVELYFYKKKLKLFKDEIGSHNLPYELRLTYEWLDNDHIKIYDYIFEFSNNSVKLIN
ncbi:MAG: hypothetical protein JXR88_00910 [Clostridia bacterium]|nr:hypothetical protein [Clostridia bacterium]